MPPEVAQATSSSALALERARSHLQSLQQPGGWWRGELETNVTMDAEDMLLREFLGTRGAEETAGAAVFIRSRQRADGTWANFHGGDALHGFIRASYGFPQSDGCVEMPYGEAAEVYPYTPIGTIVHVT